MDAFEPWCWRRLLRVPWTARRANQSILKEIRVRSLGGEDPLEKGTAIHSSIVAWRIPWTEKPDGLQSTGLQRGRHQGRAPSTPFAGLKVTGSPSLSLTWPASWPSLDPAALSLLSGEMENYSVLIMIIFLLPNSQAYLKPLLLWSSEGLRRRLKGSPLFRPEGRDGP